MHRFVTQGWVFAIVLVTCSEWNQSVIAQVATEKVVAPVVTAQQIRDLQLDESKTGKFIVVDVRSPAETEVSVIPGAITKAQFERESKKYGNRAIIVYCTVGARSATYANGLKQKGWNAWNYKGSILDWCKHQFPLTTLDGVPTKRVHTYSIWYRVPRQYEAVR